MEENKYTRELVEETVKELQAIAGKAEKCANEQEKMEQFLISQKQRVKQLGQILAAYSGIPQESAAAHRLGVLIVVNFLNQNIGNLEFLAQVLNRRITKAELKEAIIRFVAAVDAHMKQDTANMLTQLQQEIAVLQRLKESKQAARDDPEWQREITALSQKMQAMSISLGRPPARASTRAATAPATPAAPLSAPACSLAESPATSTMAQKGKAVKHQLASEPKKQKKLTDLISSLATLTCFCNFQRRHVPQMSTVVQETLLYILETNTFNYLSIIPRLCTQSYKISVEMCSPKDLSQEAAFGYQRYIVRMLQNLTDITKKDSQLLDELVSVFYQERQISRPLLQSLLLGYSPRRHREIVLAITSRSPALFYINVVRVLYLIIHDVVMGHLIIEAANQDMSLISLLSLLNRRHHEKLLIRYQRKSTKRASTDQPLGSAATKRSANLCSISFADLASKRLRRNKRLLARVIANGVFTNTGLLSGYFATYHSFRTSVLQGAAKSIAKRLATDQLQQLAATQSSLESLQASAHRQLLGFLRAQTVRFLSSKLEIAEFLHRLALEGAAQKGFPSQAKEVQLFISVALPLFVFSMASLP